MGNGSPRKRRLDRFVHHVHNVGRTHHSLVVGSYIHENLVQIHILLVMGANQIVERVPSNRQNRLPVAFRIV